MPREAIKICSRAFPVCGVQRCSDARCRATALVPRSGCASPTSGGASYGTTVVYVSAVDGRVLLAEDALRAPTARSFMSNLYPIHTGEVGWLAWPPGVARGGMLAAHDAGSRARLVVDTAEVRHGQRVA